MCLQLDSIREEETKIVWKGQKLCAANFSVQKWCGYDSMIWVRDIGNRNDSTIYHGCFLRIHRSVYFRLVAQNTIVRWRYICLMMRRIRRRYSQLEKSCYAGELRSYFGQGACCMATDHMDRILFFKCMTILYIICIYTWILDMSTTRASWFVQRLMYFVWLISHEDWIWLSFIACQCAIFFFFLHILEFKTSNSSNGYCVLRPLSISIFKFKFYEFRKNARGVPISDVI